ncbi:MAG: hypothetical protein WBG92_22735 [Thiohalocapsa sp.]
MLKRRWQINLALFAVVLLLALAARLEQRQVQLATTLTPIRAADVERVSLRRPGEPLIRLVRENDSWRMLEPFSAAADGTLIGKLLPIAAARVHRTLPAGALDLHQLGLDPPFMSLRLNALELRFGGTEPIANRRYVQVGDLVHLIDERPLPQLLAAPEDLLPKRLLPEGFSPGIGSIDGRPLTAGALADLAEAEAMRVEPLTDALGGHLLTLKSADGEKGLRFLVDDGGTRWSRVDQRLSYLFARPPLAELDEDVLSGPRGKLDALSPLGTKSTSDTELLQLRPPPIPDAVELLPSTSNAPMPTRKLTP